jgi:hypothetical protein
MNIVDGVSENQVKRSGGGGSGGGEDARFGREAEEAFVGEKRGENSTCNTVQCSPQCVV